MTHRGVQARDVRKSYGRQQVLRGIDLDLEPGEVVGLIGPNGAGKTTVMSCLLALLRVDVGAITFDGKASDDLSIRRRTGFVPERMNLGRRITGWDFLRYMARLAGVSGADVTIRCTTMFERLGLSDAAAKPLGEYSRGMLQRIALCQALIHEPDFIFLDEPASGLDPNGVLLVRELITAQKARGAIVLLNSHQLAEVEKVCDRVLFLQNGVIAREETLRHANRFVVAIRLLAGSYDPHTVQRTAGTAPKDDVVIISGGDDADIAAIVRQIVMSGAGVVEVRAHTADLESMFRGVA